MSSAQIVSASVIHSKLRIPFGMSPMSALGMPGMIEHGIPQSSPSYLKQEMAPLMSPPAVRSCYGTVRSVIIDINNNWTLFVRCGAILPSASQCLIP